MTEPTTRDGPVALVKDEAGYFIAYHAWRTICATKDREAAQRCLDYHLQLRPDTEVVGSW